LAVIKKVLDFLREMIYNGGTMKNKNSKSKIKLVLENANERSNIFIDSLEDSHIYTTNVGGASSTEDFNIFFNFSGFENDKTVMLQTIVNLEDEDTLTIFDISDESFLEGDNADYYVILAAAASFVTCSSEFIQESLYDQTGRLAYLVPQSLTKEDLKQPQYEPPFFDSPKILWYGDTKDIMSVRPYLTTNVHNIKIATSGFISNTKDRAETTVFLNNKKKRDEIEKADIIYLPPTYSRQGEIRRYQKVEECIKEGKLVVAPALDYDWDGLAMDCTLEQAIEKAASMSDPNGYIRGLQNRLYQKYSPEVTIDAVKAALELAPEDAYQKDLENMLGKDIVLL